jgi:hypothetical protein
MDTNKSTAGQRAAAIESTKAAESKDNEIVTEARRSPVRTNTTVTTTDAGLRSTEGREDSIRREEDRLKSLNEANREGHDKNIQRIEEQAEQAAANSEKGPTSGKEWNRNTPRIDANGNKHWD